MKYTAEEVRARFEAWLIREHEYAPEDLIWQEKRNCYADYATHLAWNAYRDAYADLLERIKADEMGVSAPKRQYYYRVDGCTATDATDPKCICWHDEGTGPLAHGDYLPKSWRDPPAQAAQSVDIEAIREVIESHINEAKNLRHDPESQNYLCAQADKLETALQEKGNG